MKNRLMRLLRDNAQAKARLPLNVVLPRADDTTPNPEATIYLYDVIVSDDWWGGVTAEAFVTAMAEASLSADIIHLRINCPGGDVFAARAMEAAVRGCPKKVVAHVDGYAASAASYLALACDSVEIAQGGFFMIHKAWTVAMGNADELMATASLLTKIDASLVDTYVAETGQTAEAIQAMMAAETWLTSQEAVDLGFADCIATDAAKDPCCASTWNLAAYANAPKAEQQDVEPEPEPAPQEPEPQAPPAEDVPSGEAEPCTSDADVGLNPTEAFSEAYFAKINRRAGLLLDKPGDSGNPRSREENS